MANPEGESDDGSLRVEFVDTANISLCGLAGSSMFSIVGRRP